MFFQRGAEQNQLLYMHIFEHRVPAYIKKRTEGPITAVKVYKDSLTIKSELISDLEANYQKTLKDYKIIHEKPLLPNTHHY
jgi:hypothetical protein